MAVDQNLTEQKLRFIESLFVKYGGVPTALSEDALKELGMRQIYALNGNFYRTDLAEIDGQDFILLSVTDNEKYAEVGIMEDIDALSPDLEDAGIEKAVRYALGIDPYPDRYPVI